MQSNTFVDVTASVAAVAAAGGLLYARASARAAHAAVDASRRTVEIAERSRQAADRARLRLRVERVGELVQALAASPQVDPATGELSEKTGGQVHVLSRALIGLHDILPRSSNWAGHGRPVRSATAPPTPPSRSTRFSRSSRAIGVEASTSPGSGCRGIARHELGQPPARHVSRVNRLRDV